MMRNFYEPFHANLESKYTEVNKEDIVPEEKTEEICEKCKSPMIVKTGRYGKFLACSGFPDCRNTKPILKTIDVKCPKCNGEIVERKGKKKYFYGCNNYPECDFLSFDKPISRLCPKCNKILVEKKSNKKTQVKCSECDYKEEAQ